MKVLEPTKVQILTAYKNQITIASDGKTYFNISLKLKVLSQVVGSTPTLYFDTPYNYIHYGNEWAGGLVGFYSTSSLNGSNGIVTTPCIFKNYGSVATKMGVYLPQAATLYVQIVGVLVPEAY